MHAFALNIGIALLAAALPASAHYIWIERQDDEREPGQFEGKSYDNLRHRMTLSVLKVRNASRQAVTR